MSGLTRPICQLNGRLPSADCPITVRHSLTKLTLSYVSNNVLPPYVLPNRSYDLLRDLTPLPLFTEGVFEVSLYSTSMTSIQIASLKKAARVLRRKAAESSKSIADMRNQLVIV